MDNGVLQSDMNDRIPAKISLEANGGSTNYEDDIRDIDNPQHRLFGMPNVLGRDSHGTDSSSTLSDNSKHLNVEELEMLLEAYFVQIDGTLNKLSTVRNSTLPVDCFICFILHYVNKMLKFSRIT
ncbi:hypothetical protein L1049_015816 [Liquidambar formosana]|uniref:Uncharacterized protein n=1 Tax=Liquidambar formosana TaxID=63359 RepID=A0AAP0RYQ1_LIQFO